MTHRKTVHDMGVINAKYFIWIVRILLMLPFKIIVIIQKVYIVNFTRSQPIQWQAAATLPNLIFQIRNVRRYRSMQLLLQVQ